jgi:PAS domain S-box-containing protein
MQDGRRTILLVEDEAIIALSTAKALEREGYRIIHVLSGEKAIEASSGPIDLILMDVDLGRGMDGTRAAREILKTRDIPIVFLSSHTEQEIVEKTEKITSYGYAVKNSGLTVLLVSIKMALRLHDAHSDLRRTKMEIEAINEELYATNGELMATNEELLRSQRELLAREAALARSESFLNSIIDQSPHPMWISDRSGTLVRINKACCDMLSISESDVAGKYNILSDNIVEEQGFMPMVRAVFEKGITARFELIYESARLRHPALSAFASVILDVTIFPIRDGGGIITNAIIQHINITARKRAEASLEKYRIFLEIALESGGADSWEMNLVTGEISYTERWASRLGYAPGEIAPTMQGIAGVIHPDDVPGNYAALNAYIEGSTPEYETECRLRTKQGEWIWVLSRGRAVEWDSEGTPVRLMGTNFDITRRKLAEEKNLQQNEALADTLSRLRINERRYTKSQEIAHTGNWEYNLQTTHFWGSDEAKRIYGFDPSQPDFSTEEVESCIPERERVHQALIDLIELGKEYNLEFEIIPRNSTERKIIASTAELQQDGEGNPLKVTGVIQDITARRRMEQALASADNRLELAQRAAGIGVWDWDVATGNIVWTMETFKLFGLDPGAHPASFEAWRSVLHPDDREMAEHMIARSLEERTFLDNMYRIILADGQVRWISAKGEGVYDDAGRPLRMTGVCIDITSLRRADEALHESERRYRSLFTHMFEGMAYCKMLYEGDRPADFIYLEVNDAFERQTGLKGVTEKRVSEVIPGIRESNPGLFEIYARVAQTGEPEQFEMHLEALEQWFHVSVYSPSRGHFISLFDVITQRKRDEEALKNSLEEKQTLLNELQHRVKNSLAIITGIIDLEARRLADKESRAIVKNIRDKVSSLSTLYGILYHTRDATSIRLDVYLGELSRTLFESYITDAGRIRLETELGELIIAVKTAVPLGLIATELITNSLKYAFPGDARGAVRIMLGRDAENLVLEIADDGAGISGSGENGHASGLGFSLVRLLCEQIDGGLEQVAAKGTCFRVTAPLA